MLTLQSAVIFTMIALLPVSSQLSKHSEDKLLKMGKDQVPINVCAPDLFSVGLKTAYLEYCLSGVSIIPILVSFWPQSTHQAR